MAKVAKIDKVKVWLRVKKNGQTCRVEVDGEPFQIEGSERGYAITEDTQGLGHVYRVTDIASGNALTSVGGHKEVMTAARVLWNVLGDRGIEEVAGKLPDIASLPLESDIPDLTHRDSDPYGGIGGAA